MYTFPTPAERIPTTQALLCKYTTVDQIILLLQSDSRIFIVPSTNNRIIWRTRWAFYLQLVHIKIASDAGQILAHSAIYKGPDGEGGKENKRKLSEYPRHCDTETPSNDMFPYVSKSEPIDTG